LISALHMMRNAKWKEEFPRIPSNFIRGKKAGVRGTSNSDYQ
jgi:hypothetical protein